MGQKQNKKEWEYINEWFQSPKGVGTLITFFAIWAITAFNPWVAFGLSFAVWGSAQSYAKKRSKQLLDKYLEDDDSDETWTGEHIYYEYAAGDNKTSVPETNEYKPLEINKKIIEDAKPDLKELKAAAGVATGDLGTHLRSIVKNAEIIEHELIKDSSKLSDVQRVFTYYIPATSDLLAARGRALGNNDEIKVAEIDLMLSRIEIAFGDFAARMHGEDVRSIDIDIKLLDQSLKQDLPYEIRTPLNAKTKQQD